MAVRSPEPGKSALAGRNPHPTRLRAMLRAHPELRELVGPYRRTSAWIAAFCLIQLGIACAAREAPWWLVVLSAYAAGAVVSLGLWTLIHECAHDLVLASARANRWLGILAGLPLVIPAATSFRTYHLLHHRHLGEAILDGDVPSAWEVRLVGNSPARKALWLACNAAVQAVRPLRMRSVALLDRWSLLNLGLQAGFDALIVAAVGPRALAYLLLSNLFALGLHPLGARWIQEHFDLRSGQATHSYYGSMNLLVFNAGYHCEHHDLMRVAWIRLPLVRRMAPEFYRDLHSYRSWTALLVTFLLDPRATLASRCRQGERRP